ncbi:hypothetical protein [Persephonella sp. KM09-Lau-8]|uniref:hypothetical protein n=1 Tax=Persephonella sp. KM09-Lau-8 TaxID=1158345 RepID=UPI000496BD8D|nr:hypothetical protein [Persephonella sp. KM09-Lau-8]
MDTIKFSLYNDVLSPEEIKMKKRTLKYLLKNPIYFDIFQNPELIDLAKDIFHEIITFILEKKKTRLSEFKAYLDRKYLVSFKDMYYSKHDEFSHLILPYIKEYKPRSCKSYFPYTFYLPEEVWEFIERIEDKNISAGIRILVEATYDINPDKKLIKEFKSKRKNRSVKLTLPIYFKLIAEKKKTGLSFNELILYRYSILPQKFN